MISRICSTVRSCATSSCGWACRCRRRWESAPAARRWPCRPCAHRRRAPSARSPAGGAAHDGVVHQQHVAALELAGDHVELLAHRLLAHALPRHDEGAADVAVLHETFAVGQAQHLRQLHGAGARGFGDRDDHVDLARRHGGDHALGQRLAHVQARLVDRDAVEHRVRPRQVHVFEDAGVVADLVGALLEAAWPSRSMNTASPGATSRSSSKPLPSSVTDSLATITRAVGVAAHAQRADAERIAEGQQAVAGDQRDHRVRALDALVHARARRRTRRPA
jgi:hypothetical protein